MESASAPVLDFENIALYQSRKFVPVDAKLSEVAVVKGLMQLLVERNITSKEDLERWILDRSEFESAMSQTGSVIYIQMTCHTDDEKKVANYKNFIEEVAPVMEPLSDQLNRKLLDAVKKYPLDMDRYGILIKDVELDINLFSQKNVPIKTKVALLSQEYQALCGGLTVEFEGEERTMPQMSKYLLDTNRDLRKKAWRVVSQRRLKEKEKLEDMFDQMLKLRSEIALNAGCKDFVEYKFKSLHRFDYTPADCKKYHKTVEELVVPLVRQILEKRKHDMKLDVLRPWDTAVDPLGRAPLKPFSKVEELVEGCQKIFEKVDSRLADKFKQMLKDGLLDLESRKGKAPGGYQSCLDESRKPFIFMNAVGLDGDVKTLLHESGHAFHSLSCAADPLVDYRHGPMEFNEVASMAMELLAGEFMNVFYNQEDEQRAKESHFEDAASVLIWVAIVDAFQHWIYENPTHTQKQRRDEWIKIRNRFSTNVIDWTGFEEEQAYIWHRQLHIFEVPFYYIEYGIAQLGSLQLWLNFKRDQKKTVDQYLNALSFGGAKPLPELYEKAGIKFDFSYQTIAPLMEAVKKELGLD